MTVFIFGVLTIAWLVTVRTMPEFHKAEFQHFGPLSLYQRMKNVRF
jgi:hypothetical protein